MNRPICIACAGYIIGIIWGLYFSINIVFFFALIYILFLITQRFTFKKPIYNNCRRYLKTCLKPIFVGIVCISGVISNMQITHINKDYAERYKEIESGEYRGVIISSPIEKEYTYVYTIKVESIGKEKKKFQNTKLLLYVKKEKENTVYDYGDYIRFTGEFSEAQEQRNYKGFNYREYLKSKNIYGIVRTGNIEVLVKDRGSFLGQIISNIRTSITGKLEMLLPRRTNQLACGILLGKMDAIPEEDIEYFRESSLAHVLAVSGGHTAYVILGIAYVLNKSNLSKKFVILFTILILFLFMLLTGASSSVIRACIMASVIIFSKIVHKKADMATTICFSLLIMLIINPFYLLDIGLLLSYGGTIGIILFQKTISKFLEKRFPKGVVSKYIREVLAVTISAQIIILPITVVYFNTINTVFALANLLASPLIGAIMLLGFFTIVMSYVFLPIASIIAFFLDFLLFLLLSISKYVSIIPFANFMVITPSGTTIWCYYALTIYLNYMYQTINIKNRLRRIERVQIKTIRENLIKKFFIKYKRKVLCTCAILCVLFLFHKQVDTGLKIYAIDVGQGDRFLVVTAQGERVLIDGGGTRDNSVYDVGKNVVVPYLLDRKIFHLDYVIISHFDSDHCNRLGCGVGEFRCGKGNYFKTTTILKRI